MKIGIVTVYNTENCGSFLQAYALCRALEKQGHQVYFLKGLTSTENRYWYRLLQATKYVLKCDFLTARELTETYPVYHLLQKKFQITEELQDLDLIIYGSDTIWNIANGYFLKNWKHFFGHGVKTRKISYAASVGSTTLDAFVNVPEIKTCLSEFSGLGIRDIPTGEIVHAFLPEREDVVQVVDPTMLLACEDYEAISAECPERNFILVYYFGAMPEELTQKIRAFAKSQNKKIIAFGNRPWADITLPFDPRLMMGYYKYADYVVTNTFHGNIFSILFGKQFVSFGKKKRKVEALLNEFNLSNRLAEKADEMEEIFMQEIDHDAVQQKIKTKREASYQYLEEFLKA